jgi:glyoxylase-like metal-dependent hydrolase (beta-lactamase superfamily II)
MGEAQAPEPATVLADGVVRFRSRMLGQNSYLLRGQSGGYWWIDPGFDAPTLEPWLHAEGMRITGVLCTHGHFDHIAGAAWCQERYEVAVFVSKADRQIAQSSNFLLMAMKRPERLRIPHFSWMPISEDGSPWTVEPGVSVEPSPGHTPGSCVVRTAGHVFSGDTLYAGGMNYVALPGEDRPRLIESLRALCASLDPSTMVYPGHGDHGRFADIQLTNQELRAALAAG